MVSAYNQFVSQHIRSMPGATQKDKMRAVAAKWRAMKGRGKKGASLMGDLRRVGRVGVSGYLGGIPGLLTGIAADKLRKGKGVRSILPAREGASGGRVRKPRGKQAALAAMLHGLGLRI